jgi:hypothetical protein
MLKELHKSKKPLSLQRINDLKNLKLMTSPYNDAIIQMIKIEVIQQKKHIAE